MTVVLSADERETFSLVRCDGTPLPDARARLSVLLRPHSVGRPAATDPNPDAPLVAPGIRRVDEGLLVRLDAIATRFDYRPIHVVSGFRPLSQGSMHQLARASDVRVEGVRNEELVAFCKGLDDTGCGYYPNSSFVHVDVRPKGTGHVAWIDASGPGETPRYVASWPPPRRPLETPASTEPPRSPAEPPASAEAPPTTTRVEHEHDEDAWEKTSHTDAP